MIQFLTQLTKGIQKKEIPKSYRELTNYLLSIRALKKGKKKLLKLSNDYVIGPVDINSKGVGFVTPHTGKKDLLIEPEHQNGAKKGDIVLAKRYYKKSGRPKAKVILLLKKAFETLVGYLSLIPTPRVLNIKNNQEIPVNIKQKQLKKYTQNSIFKIDAYTFEIEEFLGVLDDPQVDEKISLALYNRKEEFSKQAIREAESFGDYVDKTLYAREDLTHLPFCTIDPETAKDHDDAIYFDPKKRTLYVAIADVSEYVYLNGAIDKEARERSFSIYFPHKSIPMLPRALSENICSLKENEDRLTLTFKITLNENNEVVKEELSETIINSKRKYSYNTIDKFLEGKAPRDEVDEQILKWLLPLYEITKNLKYKRLQKGLEFFSDEIKMVLDEDGKIKKVEIEKETPSHSLIEDCMLLANKAAAKMIEMGIFRVHDAPQKKDLDKVLKELLPLGIDIKNKKHKNEVEILKEIQKQAKELKIEKYVDQLLIKSQKQAKYDAFNRGHFALGFEKYTHFTSPIRRYSDLTLHRLLKSILHNNQKFKKFVLRNIESLVAKISELEREAIKVEWDFYDRKFARWAHDRIGQVVNAVIIDIKYPPIAKVEDEIVGARIFLKDKKVTLFEKKQVKISEVNLATTKIKGKIVNNNDI